MSDQPTVQQVEPGPGPTLIVDGANVVGSRPDGWWKDRAGAARRLQEQLAGADLGFDHVVLVLEGRARAGAPVGHVGRLETVHAEHDGDSAIVELCRSITHQRAVVTADRALSTSVQRLGATVLRPGWLLQLLETRAASDPNA